MSLAARQLQPIWSQLPERVVSLRRLASSARDCAWPGLLEDLGLETPKEVPHDASSPSDRTSSNRAGVTLMNNQVGYVVAHVMPNKKDITIPELPSMIRVDGINWIDFDFQEIADALGWADFGNDDFEEIMSDALRPHGGARRPGACCSPTRRTRPSTSTSTSKLVE